MQACVARTLNADELKDLQSANASPTEAVKARALAAEFSRLSDAGIAELVKIPGLSDTVEAIFTQLPVTETAVLQLKAQCHHLKCVRLGREITLEAYELLLQQASKHHLDFTSWSNDRRSCDGVNTELRAGRTFDGVTDQGLRELSAILVPADLRAVFFTAQLHTQASSALDELRIRSPLAHFVTIGVEITMSVRTAAADAEKALDGLQQKLRSVPEAAVRDERDTARLESIATAEALSEALAPGSFLADHIQVVRNTWTERLQIQSTVPTRTAEKEILLPLSEQMQSVVPGLLVCMRTDPSTHGNVLTEASWHSGELARQVRVDFTASGGPKSKWIVAADLAAKEGTQVTAQEEEGASPTPALAPPELGAWCRAEAEAQHLAALATECQRVIDAAEPTRSMDALQALKHRGEELRQEVEKCRALIVPLRIEMTSPKKRVGGEDLVRTQTAPEMRQARAALLAQPMEEWSEAQVQEWIALIGLPAEQVEVVQRALAAYDMVGEDLEGLKKNRLFRQLKKAGADDPAALAEQTMKLHETAQGGAGAESKLAAEQARLDETRQALHMNSKETKVQVRELVSLASQHFPELLHSNDDVKTFMGSDGLQMSERQLADYDDMRTLVIGRSKLLLKELDGVEVVLKEFPLQDDMRGYLKEIMSVQRLNHRHIIRYNAVFEDMGSMYIEMEYCKHGSLTDWMKASDPDAAQKQSVLRQVVLALACMHEQKIVHCDIKGENILIAEDGTARICDFELSKDLAAASTTMLGGTQGFIAPEVQAWIRATFSKDTDRGEVKDKLEKPSAASDMFSFGVVALNTLYPPSDGQPYPRSNASVISDPVVEKWVTLLMHEQPTQRPTAMALQAEPYFEVDRVIERRAQEAEVVAAQQMAEAERQMAAAQAVEAKAKEDAATAARTQVDATKAVVQAKAVEKRAKRDNAEQVAEAKAQIKTAQAAEKKAKADTAAAAIVQEKADAQIAEAKGAQTAAAEAEHQAKAEKAALLAPLRVTTSALLRNCELWAEIQTRMQESLPQHVVTRLREIDNNQLLMDFDRQKEIVAAKPANASRGGTIENMANVRFGFHAMAGSPDELKKIYEGGRADGGFDYRLGREGAYGRGSYFAEHAIYSAYLFPRPARAADGSVVLLVADVILGQSKGLGTRRDHTLVREPPIEGGAAGDVYDSVQGTEGGFGIHGPIGVLHHPRPDARQYGANPEGEEEYGRQYIVYDKAKAYPRYLVTIRPQ